jgi:hypothetical protein
MLRSYMTAICLLGVSGALSAGTITGVCGTGFSNSTCGTLDPTTGADTDGNWTITPGGSGGSAFVTVPNGAWLNPTAPATTVNAEWIAPSANEATAVNGPSFTYTETFNISVGENLSTASIVGQIACDNNCVIDLNGNQIGAVTMSATSFSALTSFSINSDAADFNIGMNTLSVVVSNQIVPSDTPTGLIVGITSATIDASAPEPASFGFIGLGLAALGILGKRIRS